MRDNTRINFHPKETVIAASCVFSYSLLCFVILCSISLFPVVLWVFIVFCELLCFAVMFCELLLRFVIYCLYFRATVGIEREPQLTDTPHSWPQHTQAQMNKEKLEREPRWVLTRTSQYDTHHDTWVTIRLDNDTLWYNAYCNILQYST